MKKMHFFKDIVPVRMGEAWCDFCGELRPCIKASKRLIVTKSGKEIDSVQADICYDCGRQAAEMLLKHAEVMDDEQINP